MAIFQDTEFPKWVLYILKFINSPFLFAQRCIYLTDDFPFDLNLVNIFHHLWGDETFS